MTWKAIGASVKGTSHTASGKDCEDAIQYCIATTPTGDEVLICCGSDGAGSAAFAGEASKFCVQYALDAMKNWIASGTTVGEPEIYLIVEQLYEALAKEAEAKACELNEFSCTLLGAVLTGDRSVFFQIGDGAIVRNDGSDFYLPVWWPDNGEYQNTTSFLIDDINFKSLNITVLEERVNEIALFTDGLQMLALNIEKQQVHQPFFTDLFRYLRMAAEPEHMTVLQRKLVEYLDSRIINDRTDDDKTLFMATRY